MLGTSIGLLGALNYYTGMRSLKPLLWAGVTVLALIGLVAIVLGTCSRKP